MLRRAGEGRMTSSPFSPARVAVSETFRFVKMFEVRIRAGSRAGASRLHPSLGSCNPARAIVIRRQYQSAPGHSSRRVSGRLPGVVQRFTPLALRLPALFPETGGTFLRGLLNLCRALPGWSTGFLRTLAQPRKQSSSVFTVLFRPSPSCALVHVEQHERRRLQCPTKVLKEPTK